MKYLVASVVIFAVGLTGVFTPARGIAQLAASPIQLGLSDSAANINGFFGFFANIGRVKGENQKLLTEVEKLNSELVAIKDAQRENAFLKEQLGLKQENIVDKELVLAGVLGNPTDQTGASVILNKGAKYGVKAGDNVIKGAHLVGIVREVTLGRSVVDLITSPNVSVTVYDIDVAGKTSGLAVGQFGTAIQMTRILPKEDISVGDTIVSLGADGLFEPGLIVGKVVEVAKDSSQPLKTAFLDTVIDLSKLDKVFVIVER